LTTFIENILELSRQNSQGGLSPWFIRNLENQIDAGVFLVDGKLDEVGEALARRLADYRKQAGVSTAVLGMSGGVDSALTAVLFKRADWRVVGFTLPIDQNPEETARGVEACEALGLEHHNIDLTELYQATIRALTPADPSLPTDDAARLRRGNLRARLRMVTLYNMAASHGGLVASTDNYSELGAGFWTLHGDVGDVSPIQSLLKSWEVPYLAKSLGVPRSTWAATPTDGLATGGTDEQQIGASYLEWDIMVAALQAALTRHGSALTRDNLATSLDVPLDVDERAQTVFRNVTRRLGATWYKRINPLQFEHPVFPRLQSLVLLDAQLFQPSAAQSQYGPQYGQGVNK
jgi:nicotinamide-nucleotide amidase